MAKLNTTKQARALHTALTERGIDAVLENWDGHKHTDISVPEVKLHIEIDGDIHFTNARTIETDIVRDKYSSGDGYDTFRVPNCVIDEELDSVVEAVCRVIEDRR